MKISIIGGYNLERYGEPLSKVENMVIRFHDGRPKRRNKKCMEILIKDADYVIIVQSVCSHSSMWDAKAVAKKCKKKVYYAHKQGLASILNTIESQHKKTRRRRKAQGRSLCERRFKEYGI